MNLPFAAWAFSRRACRGDDVRVMFHEIAFPWVRRPIRHNVLAAVNRLMAILLIRACSRAYVTIPGWEPQLRRLGAGRLSIIWTPIFSNIPDEARPVDVERRRAEVTGGHLVTPVVGHFGTYGPLVIRDLEPVLREILDRRENLRVLLIGSGGDRWRREFLNGRPDWSDRVVAPGSLPGATTAEYLRACDLMIQLYSDGVSSRRTTLMAAMANGVPVISTIGAMSEPIWNDGPVAIASPAHASRIAELTEELLDGPDRRAELGRAGRRMYEDRFALRHTIAALLAP